jgi:Ca2+-binding RTX toxin-like protein
MRRTIVLLATMALTLLVASGVALAVTRIGTNGPDTLRGTNGADNLLGNGGNDILYALGGNNDNLLGGEGKDWTLGGVERRPSGGDKNLVGGPGNDGVQGGLGSDTLLGGSGNDFVHGDYGSDRAVVGGEGKDIVDGSRGSDCMLGGGGGDVLQDGPLDETSKDDVLSSGEGDDIIVADHVPATKDLVWCGGGFDRVLADRKDVVADDCEKVRVVHGTEAEVEEQEQAFIESLPPAVSEFFGTFFERDAFFEEQLAPDPTAGG